VRYCQVIGMDNQQFGIGGVSKPLGKVLILRAGW
jgi:hypothetical protein